MDRPFVLVDQARLRQFTLLGRARRLFEEKKRLTWTDANGVVWTGARVESMGFAVSALGPGWAFDPVVQEQRPERLVKRRQLIQESGIERALAEAVDALR